MTGAFGYWRTTGRPIAFPAKAIVLATGGIGKAYEVTSNSWEYSGDGQALAYDAGAELIDMEFVQFHPTGMVWPPGVRGLLVTEAVRGEGGILRNAVGERFMWTYLPEDRRAEYAATDEEAARWVTALSAGPGDGRPPPARAVHPRQRRPGDLHRGQGRARLAPRRRLPRHQLSAGRPRPAQAALDVRAVQGTRRRRHHGRADGGRSHDPLRDGWDPRSTPRPARPPCPGLFAAGEVVRRDARRESPGRQLPVGPARVRAADRGRRSRHAAAQTMDPYMDPFQIDEATRDLAAPLERTDGEDPYAVQRDLQATMQSLVGIFRVEADLIEAIDRLADLRSAHRDVKVTGGRVYNPGWNLVFELQNTLDRVRGDRPERAAADREPRRPQPPRLPRDRRRRLGRSSTASSPRARTGR